MGYALAGKAAEQIEALSSTEADALREAAGILITPEKLRATLIRLQSPHEHVLSRVLEFANDQIHQLELEIKRESQPALSLLRPEGGEAPMLKPTLPDIGIGGIKTDDGVTPSVRRLFIEGIGRPPEFLPLLTSRDDLDHVGPIDKAAAIVFWQRMDAYRRWTLEPGVGGRYELMVQDMPYHHAVRNSCLLQLPGFSIEGLRAKDSRGRFAYYHLLLSDHRHQAFFDEIKKPDMLDLLEYGHVACSVYEDIFLKRQRQRAEDEVKAWIARYDALAVRERSYWMLSGDFDRELSHVELPHRTPTMPDVTNPAGTRRLGDEAAAAVLNAAGRYGLTIAGLRDLTDLFVGDPAPLVDRSLGLLRDAVRRQTRGDRLVADILSALLHPNDLLSQDFMPHATEVAALAVLTGQYGINHSLDTICTVADALEAERHIRDMSEYIRARAADMTFEQPGITDEPTSYGLALGTNVRNRFLSFIYGLKEESPESRILMRFTEVFDIFTICSLARVGKYIENDRTGKADIIGRILEASLDPLFMEFAYPETRRRALVAEVTGKLLAAEVVDDKGTWVERTSGGNERRASHAPLDDPRSLPDRAPALWKSDKQTGDTPPDFIKRHYGPWLRANVQGLTRPQLRKFDPTLYMALANWLQRNDMPSDCPLPTKSQHIDYLLRQSETSPSTEESLIRLGEAARWRQKRRAQATSRN